MKAAIKKNKVRAIIPGTKGKPTFAKLTRQCTGSSMMDSGGESGRHWQQKLPSNDISFWSTSFSTHRNEAEIYAHIPLHTFLDSILEIDVKLTKRLREIEAEDSEAYSIFGASEAMQAELDMVQESLDYTYNWENDLTQDFQFAILRPKTGRQDIYNEGSIVLIQTHNGADARGGFSDTIVCKFTGEHTALYESEVGWTFSEGKDATGKELTQDEYRDLAEEFEPGYQSNPTYAFNKAIAELISVDKEAVTVTVKLKTGETVVAYPIHWGLMG